MPENAQHFNEQFARVFPVNEPSELEEMLEQARIPPRGPDEGSDEENSEFASFPMDEEDEFDAYQSEEDL